MKYRKYRLWALLFLMGTGLCAKDPVIRIAVIDMNKVFESYSKTKINETKLKNQSEIFRKYAGELSGSIQKMQKEFLKLRSASQNLAYTGAERENMRPAGLLNLRPGGYRRKVLYITKRRGCPIFSKRATQSAAAGVSLGVCISHPLRKN